VSTVSAHPCQGRQKPGSHTLLISALLSTRSATASGCFFSGDDIMLPSEWFAHIQESRRLWWLWLETSRSEREREIEIGG
jgi:hypothetical protein